jgi:hypothetical protein
VRAGKMRELTPAGRVPDRIDPPVRAAQLAIGDDAILIALDSGATEVQPI